MIKKYFLFAITAAIFLIASCNDSTIDPGGDKDSGNRKYVFYSKMPEGGVFIYYWYSNFQIRRVDTETMEDVLIRDTSLLVGIAGNKVYYVVYNHDNPWEVDLRRCDENGKNDELLSNWYAYQPRIFQLSPDGMKILYFTRKTKWEVHCSDIDSSNDKLLYSLNRYTGENPLPYASFSMNMKRIGIADQDPYPLSYLYSNKFDGSNLKYEWAVDGFGKMLGGLSPDGMSFAYDSLKPGAGNNFDIAIIDFTNYRKKKITSENKACYNISWSPEGSKLAYYWDAGKLFLIDTSGANKLQVTNITSNPGDLEGLYPKWSADSKWLLFGTSANAAGGDIYLGDLKLYNLATKTLKTLVPEEKVWNAFFM